MQLRDYQEESITAIRAAWKDGIARPAVVLPTGAGKTVVFAHLLAAELPRLRAEGKRAVVLAHRGELLEQAAAKIADIVPEAYTVVYKAGRGAREAAHADIVVASMQTLARPKRRAALGGVGLVIVDECHRAASQSYRDILSHYGCLSGHTPAVGVTATLTRTDGGLPDVWETVVYQRRIHWMIKNGYLVSPVAKSIDIGLNLAKTRVTGGDLNARDVADALADSEGFATIAAVWADEARERPTIVFMPNVATCEAMSEAFGDQGVAAEVITGSMSARDRAAAYARFNDGSTRVLISCMVLTEGFDAPATSCVIIGRPTINPGLYIQMVGRGLRLAEGKTDCLVLDVAGASLKHDLAGVNDLESDCGGSCQCSCLSCGCDETHCKCGVRQCGCRCLEDHEAPSRVCKCAGDGCGCGCIGDGPLPCVCDAMPDCGCRTGPESPEEGETVDTSVLRSLRAVDILGEATGKSAVLWLKTAAGIPFVQVSDELYAFVLPAKSGDGYHYGLLADRTGGKGQVTRLDDGPMSTEAVREVVEELAEKSGYRYNSRRASWRRKPASERQLAMMKRLGIASTEGMRKGEASNAMTAHRVSRHLDGRFSSYVTG